MPLPLPLFSCKSLVILKLLGRFVINVAEYVSLPSLKTVCLQYVVFCGDNSVKRLLFGSPVLEEFIVDSCDMKNIEVFAVFSPSLKRFDIYNCDGDYELSVKAPNLKYFNSNSYALRGCSGEAFKYPVEACIIFDSIPNFGDDVDFDVHNDYFAKMHEFVNKACNAQKLMLHRLVMQGVVRSQHLWPTFHTLTYLDLLAEDCKVEGWKLFPDLLESSPCLETLIIWGFRNRDVQFPGSGVPECFSMNLKTIHLNWSLGWDTELIMVEYILANAKVVKKLIICPDPECNGTVDGVCEEVSAFLIYSKVCQIKVTALECKEDFQHSSRFDLSTRDSFESDLEDWH